MARAGLRGLHWVGMRKMLTIPMLLGCLPGLCAFGESAQLDGPLAAGDAGLVAAVKVASAAGLRDVEPYPKQSFTVRWNGATLGRFVSLGGREPGSPYECLHVFVPAGVAAGPVAASSLVVTAGAGKLGATICDHPRAIGVLASSPDQVRVGILYAVSEYMGGGKDAGVDAPPVSAAVVIDAKTRKMLLDGEATEVLQKAAPDSLPAMRKLF